jgi:hypothetical protein
MDRVSARVGSVGAMLGAATTAVLSARGDASAASRMMTVPKNPEDPEHVPGPCFLEGEQAVIAEAVNLADAAAAELNRRPPDYRKALATLQSAAARLNSHGPVLSTPQFGHPDQSAAPCIGPFGPI